MTSQRLFQLDAGSAIVPVVLSALIAGCTGQIGATPSSGGQSPGGGGQSPGGGNGGSGGNITTAALCAGGAPLPIDAPTPLPRLSRVEYMNVINDVITAWAPSLATAVMTADPVTQSLSLFGPDTRVTGSTDKRGGFRRLDQDVQQDHVDATFAIAQAIAAQLTQSRSRINTLLGACASDTDTSNDAACVRTFVQSAGRVASRRPLAAEDIDFYVSVYAATGIDAAGLADVITVMLTSPYLFYQVEHGGVAVDASKNLYALDGQELANRLSLQFWGTIPDITLTGMVDSGAILTDDGYAKAVDYLATGPRFQARLSEFYREFMSLEDLSEMDRLVGTPQFDAVRGNFTPTPDTRENMIDETTRLALYYTLQPTGVFSDLFTTRKSFATTPDVAQIYGVAPWSGTGEPPDIPDGQRVGLLTHAALTASGAAITRPVIKGVVVRTVLMCQPLGQPPANAMAVASALAATLDPLSSTRAFTQSLTENMLPCSGCHKTQINPLGFATENFDSLGRLRTMEKVFDASGTLLGQVPIDTSAVPNINPNDSSVVANAVDLQMDLLKSQAVQDCMARKYFRFTFAKLEDTNDACTIESMTDGFVQGRPLGQVLLDLAKTPAFKQRRFN